jgi:hypothetical protein
MSTEKSDKIIQRYVEGMVYEIDSIVSIVMDYKVNNEEEFIFKLNSAIKDFLENADIQNLNGDRNIKEFKIFSNVHGLKSKKSQKLFAELLEHIMSNRTIISEYNWNQEKPKNLLN